MLLKLVTIGHPILRTRLAKVSARSISPAKLHKLAANLVATMRKANGVGIAANQTGSPIRIIVMECRNNLRYPKRPNFPLQIYLNPEIIWKSKKKITDWEGCLSIPDYRGLVPRALAVRFRALTLDGVTIERMLRGFEARVLQHEVDHVNGFFYVDRMSDHRNWMHLDHFNKLSKGRRSLARAKPGRRSRA